MAIAFPPAPIVGQTYEYNGLQWVCTSVNPDAWALDINAGQVGTGLQEIGPVVVTVTELPHTNLADAAWLHEVYV